MRQFWEGLTSEGVSYGGRRGFWWGTTTRRRLKQRSGKKNGKKTAYLAQTEADPKLPKILCVRDAAVPERARCAAGPHAELHDWGCSCASEENARLQCVAPDGVGRVWPAGLKMQRSKTTRIRGGRRNNKGIAEFQRVVLRRFGFSYDWRRERSRRVSRNITSGTSGSSCGCWSAAIACKKKSRVNWCPKCCTVLANEQVVNGGYCWRHEDTKVEARGH